MFFSQKYISYYLIINWNFSMIIFPLIRKFYMIDDNISLLNNKCNIGVIDAL